MWPAAQVYWDGEGRWFDALVTGYSNGLHKITYLEDNMREWIDIDTEPVAVCHRYVWAKVKGHPWWPAKVRAG